ncbi:MAG: hypothetical protein HYU03_01960 [Thaumarchaeota archaeon]|nr:hypothetical protein [Nitrososphaerota archaeon]
MNSALVISLAADKSLSKASTSLRMKISAGKRQESLSHLEASRFCCHRHMDARIMWIERYAASLVAAPSAAVLADVRFE